TYRVLAGDGREGLHLQAPVPVGGTPAAITAFAYACDELDDLIVGDATGTLRTVVLGDRAISRARGADQLNAQDGAVYWSQHGGHGWGEVRWTPTAPGSSRSRRSRNRCSCISAVTLAAAAKRR